MQPVLILQHQQPEHPAYLRTWLEQHGISYRTFNAGVGQEFPTSIEPYSALAVMGGGMSANDPLLSNRQAEILILQAVLRDRPVIGHCLGGQLMTRALGGKVGPSPAPEIGWQPINWADDALVHHWFGLDPTPQVMQWHYDAFTVPPGAVRLAGSGACPNQAWCLGPHLAMQFHIEMDQSKVQAWVQDPDPDWDQAREQHASVQDRSSIIRDTVPNLGPHQTTARHVYRRWLSTTPWVAVLDRDPA